MASKPHKTANQQTTTADTEPVSRQVSPVPAPPDIEQVSLGGLYTEQVTIIPKTAATLHLVPGTLSQGGAEENRQVLVPFAEVRLGGGRIADRTGQDDIGDESDPPTLFSASMSMENFAYVLLDLTSDLKRMCTEASALARGELAVDPARMAQVRYFVAHLERQARLCRSRLDEAFGEPAPSAQE